MKSISLLIASLLSCFGLSAQSDYALFPKDSVIYASEHYEFPNVLSSLDTIDGVVYQQLHPTYHQFLHHAGRHKEWGDDYSEFDYDLHDCIGGVFDCFEWKNTHWFGDDLQYDTNGVYSFKGRFGKIFKIESNAMVDSTWVLCTLNEDIIQARVDSISYLASSIILDTVKYISLERQDINGNLVLDNINLFEIIIGQKSGLVRAPNFLNITECPNFDYYEIDLPLEEFENVGKIPNDLQIEETNRYTIWDMNVGDEFHYEGLEEYLFTGKREVRILDKWWSEILQRFIYKKNIKRESYEIIDFEDGIPVYEYSYPTSIEFDTIYLSNYEFLDEDLYGIHEEVSGTGVSKSKFNDYLFQIGYQINNYRQDTVDTWCENQMTLLGVKEHYIQGCGGPVMEYSGHFTDNKKNKLVYIEKGEYNWGNPLYLSQIENSPNQVEVYPNPASDKITIQLDYVTNGQIQLLDIAGKLVFEKSIKEGSMLQELNVANQFPGIYFIRILNNGVEVKTEKIIIQ